MIVVVKPMVQAKAEQPVLQTFMVVANIQMDFDE